MKTLKSLSQRFHRVKLPVIFILSLFAVYQASQLWFVNITNRNFFLQFFHDMFNATEALSTEEDISILTKPYRIVSGTGNGAFSIKYSDLNESAEKAYADSVINELLDSGTFAESAPVNIQPLFIKPAYVVDYAVSMPADIFAYAINKPSALLTENDVTAFSRIIIQPTFGGDENTHVYFIEEDIAHHFLLTAAAKHEVRSPAGDEPRYIFASGIFAASWQSAEPRAVSVANPYASVYGDKLMSHIRSCIEPMFDNPATIMESTNTDGALLFSNANTVVRYNQRDVLEYAYYRVGENAETDFLTDFASAAAFVAGDAYVVNEYYLAGYDENNGQRVFRFNYTIDDFPLVMPAGWPSEAENGYALEAVVERGTVIRYKKLVYNFYLDDGGLPGGEKDFVYDSISTPVPLLGYLMSDGELLELDFIE